MYLIEQVEHIYENAKKGTADYLISEFLLMHIRDIGRYSLTDIVKETGLPKSTVSMYFLSSRFAAGYTDFKNIAGREWGIVSTDLQTHLKWQKQLIEKLSTARALRSRDIRFLADQIIKAEQVLFVGNLIYRSYFSPLIYLLRSNHIRSRYILSSCLHEHRDELKNLDQTTLMIFLIPNDTFTENKFRIAIYTHMDEYYKDGGCEKIFICRYERSSENEKNVLPFKAQKNPYYTGPSIQLMAAELFTEYILRSGVDMREECYII